MRTNIQITNFAAKSLHDFFRPFKNALSRPDYKKSFSMVKGMIEGETVQLCEAGRYAQPDINPKTYCTKMSDLLTNIQFIADIQLEKSKGKKFKCLILDESDVQREYAKEIRIEKVRDGSTGNIKGQGYGLICVIGVTEDDEYVPLLFSRYESLGLAKIKAIQTIINTLGPDHGAVWLMDRGYDDKKIFEVLLDEKQEFLIRLDRQGGQRSLYIKSPEGEERYPVSMLTDHMGKTGYRRVKLPKRDEELTLIHYHHGKDEPLALLTTLSPKTLKRVRTIAKIYLKRWKIEDYFRFTKNRFELEDVMVQTPERIDGILAYVLVASAFVMGQMHKLMFAPLGAYYSKWAKKENCSLNWSSVARFFCSIFKNWQFSFRTVFKPPDPLQLALSL